MIILNVGHIQKSFAGEVVLTDATLMVRANEKVALVGKNGTGKSTLLKIIAGVQTADSGVIALQKGAKAGYLPQEAHFQSERTLYDEVEGVFEEILQVEQRMRELEQEMAHPSVYEDEDELAQRMKSYSSLTEIFERQGGFQVKAKINSILLGLGFADNQFSQLIDSMSGGEKTRAALAKLLLQEPDILLMDEPTNHLDVNAIQWLETYLRDYRGAVLIVSHDRYFLDETVSRIYEMEDGQCTEYKGNYSDFASQKETNLLLQQSSYDSQQKEIRRLEKSYQQTLAWAHQARSHKLKVKAENIRRRLERIEPVARPDFNPETMRLNLSANRRSGKDVLVVRGVKRELPDRTLFTNISFEIKLGDKLALVGPNGIGKSTLLHFVLDLDNPDAGAIRIGAGVSIAYYDQQHLELDPRKTCFEEIMDTRRMNNFEARSLLAKFMFHGDDVFKTIGQLSGGEKSRLQLAKLTITDANLIILDEPTNHLDLPSTEVLEKALSDFDGTILFVSHDRYFINQVANRVMELTPTGVREYEGNYDVYLEERTRQQASVEKKEPKRPRKPADEAANPEALEKKSNRQMSELEREIEELETRIADLERLLADPATYSDPDAMAATAREHKSAVDALSAAYERWEELAELA